MGKFLGKEVDTVEYIQVEQLSWISNNLSGSVEQIRNFGAFYLVAKHEELGGIDPELRKHLFDAVDVARINQIMTHGLYPVPSGLVSRDDATDVTPNTDRMQHGFDMAKAWLEARSYSSEKPMSLCVMMREAKLDDRLYTYLKAYFEQLHIDLIREVSSDNAAKYFLETPPERLCDLTIVGFGSRTFNEEEIIFNFFPGGIFHPLLGDKSSINTEFEKVIKIHNLSLRKAAVRDLERSLLDQRYVRTLYNLGMISIVNQDRIKNYSEMKTNHFIPLSQSLIAK